MFLMASFIMTEHDPEKLTSVIAERVDQATCGGPRRKIVDLREVIVFNTVVTLTELQGLENNVS